MISNIILGLASLYFYNLLRNKNKLWAFFFLAMSLAAFIGGIYHGYPESGNIARFISWAFLSTALFFAQWAVFRNKTTTLLLIFFLLKGITLLLLAIIYVDFVYLIIDSIISMLGFVFIGNLIFIKESYKLINIGISVSIISAIISQMKITIDPDYLTYNDIGHYITIISFLLIARGISKLEDESCAEDRISN